MNPHRTPGVVIVDRDIKPVNVRRGDLWWAVVACLNGSAAFFWALSGNAVAMWCMVVAVAFNVAAAWPRLRRA